MSRSGSAIGNGAGCPTCVARSGGELPHVGGRLHELVARQRRSHGRPRCLRSLGASSARSNRPLLATITRSLRSRSTGLPGSLERAPRARPRAAAALHPDDLAAEQESESILEDRDDIGRERAVRLAPEVRDVDREPPAGLERAHAFGEHVLEPLEILEVAARARALLRAPPRTPCPRSTEAT